MTNEVRGNTSVVRLLARSLIALLLATATLFASAGLVSLSASQLRRAAATHPMAKVEMPALATRSEIVAADGSHLADLYDEDRVPVSLDRIPPTVVDAVLAAEDAAFFDHRGVNVRGVARAVHANVASRDIRQGGSTITQQLVKNTLLTSDRTYERKAREAVLAMQLERQASKPEILERYLNTVYFGQGGYGVEAASERWFGRSIDQLGTAESALLAALISSPEQYDPIVHPDAARDRRGRVVRRMRALGFITDADADAALAAPLPSQVNARPIGPGDHFTEEVRRQLLADPRLGDTPQQRFATVFRGGITVETTLDPHLQQLAEAAVAAQLPASPFTAALVALDPRDGSVKAIVGGPGFDQAKFNIATQGARQPGSSFKPFALAAWLAAGRSPEDLVDATAPCEFPVPPPQKVWPVDNYEGGTEGSAITTVREATVHSLNCAYSRLSLALGPEKIAAMAKRLGVTRHLDSVPSIVLGTEEVTPLDMASAYATFAADGVHHAPMFIRRVVASDGHVLLENHPTGEAAVDAEVARTVTDVLQGVVQRGTGVRAALNRPVAGKTGTAQDWHDAWFVGYVPELVTAVWMGSAVGQESMANVAGIHVTGGSYPALIWHAFMQPALAGTPVSAFRPPDPARWPPPASVAAEPGTVVTTMTTTTTSSTTTTTSPTTTTAPAPKTGDKHHRGGGG